MFPRFRRAKILYLDLVSVEMEQVKCAGSSIFRQNFVSNPCIVTRTNVQLSAILRVKSWSSKFLALRLSAAMST